jgi:probable DNA metabolism protein
MEAFVRFQQTADNLYYAIIEPDYDVLPLLTKHFQDRYADQRWLIWDNKRRYGIYYDLQTVAVVTVSFEAETNNGKDISIVYDAKEELYQQLWQQYFKSVNIPARKNTRLHLQHMPMRYWKYLPEKGGAMK